MTNREIRQWYLREVSKIPELDAESKQQGRSAQQRARQAARQMLEDPEEIEQLRRRDRAKYRNPSNWPQNSSTGSPETPYSKRSSEWPPGLILKPTGDLCKRNQSCEGIS
jgi:hypothetical protein